MSSVGIYSETLGDSASTGQGTIDQVCEKAQGMGVLVIAAHIDEFNGICEISYDNVNKLLDKCCTGGKCGCLGEISSRPQYRCSLCKVK